MRHTNKLNQIWKRAFWDVYDHLGLIITLSLIWLLCAVTIILAPAATAALFHSAYSIIHNKDTHLRNFFYDIQKYFLKASSTAGSFLIILLAFLLNTKFYISHMGVIGILLAGITFWLLLLILVMSIYIFPLICIGKGYKDIFKYSFLLVMNNLKFSLQFLFFILILLLLEFVLPIIGIGFLALFSQEAFLELQTKYDPDINISESKRSFRELLKPWEYPKR